MQDSTGSVTVDGEHPEEIPLDEMGKLYFQFKSLELLLTLVIFTKE